MDTLGLIFYILYRGYPIFTHTHASIKRIRFYARMQTDGRTPEKGLEDEAGLGISGRE